MTHTYQAEIELPCGAMRLDVQYRASRRRHAAPEIVIEGAELRDRFWDRAARRFREVGPARDGRPFLDLLSPAMLRELEQEIALQHEETEPGAQEGRAAAD
ncbi:MAG: hypothetical protein KIT20_06760 [Alphaproteobacteria bacterium]|nr:hypothetical protein [Alphaproteobacteria bacterium]